VVQRRYPKARLFARFWAQCIDMWIGIAMPVIVSGIGLAMSKGRPLRIVNVLLFISSIIWAIYYTFTKDSHNEGRSIGKRAMGLMVVNVSTNQPCSAGESSIRALIKGLVGAVPFIGWCVEPGFVLFSEDGRRLGDRAAGTQVIEYRDYTGF
jgi:uncharacterized RDD family membrane protein YckC